MDRKLLATFAVALFLLSALMPASAHFTLGELDGTITRGVKYDGPYTGWYSGTGVNTHREGPLGYVFPGAGLWSESLYGGPWRWGYGYFPGSDQIHGYDPLGLRLHRGGNHYSPWESILTSVDMNWDGKYEYESKGDLIIALNYSAPNGDQSVTPPVYTTVAIYIPAAFDAYGRYTGEGFIPPVDWAKGDTSNILTTLTNDYERIWVGKADDKDPFGPGWWVVHIRWVYIDWRGTENMTRWYYIRLNGMTAPTVAGKYFFKIFLGTDSAPYWNAWPTQADAYVSQRSLPGGLLGGGLRPMPAENWPCLIVKGEVDPAYIYGVVRFGGLNPALYGKPVNLAGKVVAEGEAIDPYKWPSIVKTGRKVKAVAYFNETAHGRYALEGVAPGIYTIKASCAGYPEGAEWQITVGPGQSYSHDFYLTPGAVIWGDIFSKCGLGEIPWP
ncbi:MAG: carboxypeptidase-like regulatory domain-containing protein, partial [Candidatus Bathyarchaeia archaeon]